MAVTVADGLGDVLRTLRALVSPGDRRKISQLDERLAAKRLRVLVAGEAKRGKSTLVNALLGRDVVPTGVTPVTAVVTTVLPRDDDHDEDHLAVTFLDGRRERFDLSALGEFVSERANPNNTRRVADVRVRIDSPFLTEHHVELVDTQLGRVRADLQQRLRESTRRLARDLEQQHAGMIDRLLAALGDAARISDTARTDRAAQLAELRDRRETLRRLLAQVTRVRD